MRRSFLALLLGAFTLSCGQAIITAPVGSTMSISINPPFIAKDGDIAVVSVLILEPAGTPVPDGTVVQFFTTLGRIDEQGKTNDGVARVNLRSDARSGTAKVTAFSGPATATSDVIVGSSRPTRVSLALLDARIDLSEGRSTARFKATVTDANGNFVVSVPVRFSVVDSPSVDTIHGTDTVTDNNGDAFSSVQTRRTTPGTIRVRAEVFAGTAISGELSISVVE